LNFKFSIFFLLFFLFSCGVKSPPIPPQNMQLPNYADHFLKVDDLTEEEENKEKP